MPLVAKLPKKKGSSAVESILSKRRVRKSFETMPGARGPLTKRQKDVMIQQAIGLSGPLVTRIFGRLFPKAAREIGKQGMTPLKIPKVHIGKNPAHLRILKHEAAGAKPPTARQFAEGEQLGFHVTKTGEIGLLSEAARKEVMRDLPELARRSKTSTPKHELLHAWFEREVKRGNVKGIRAMFEAGGMPKEVAEIAAGRRMAGRVAFSEEELVVRNLTKQLLAAPKKSGSVAEMAVRMRHKNAALKRDFAKGMLDHSWEQRLFGTK